MNLRYHGISREIFDALAVGGGGSTPFATWPWRNTASTSSCSAASWLPLGKRTMSTIHLPARAGICWLLSSVMIVRPLTR